MSMNAQISNCQPNTYILDQARQKAYKFHQQLRYKHIQQYKARIRKQNDCLYNLNRLLTQIPGQMQDALQWSRQIIHQFSNSKDYKFPYQKIIELFKLIEKFPCLETINLLYSVSHRISFPGIHELFQYDIAGLLQKLITYPEKIVPKRLSADMDKIQSNKIYLETVKMSMLVLAALSEESQKARNFLVINHKSFNCISKAYSRIGEPIQFEFILCLYSFTYHQIIYDEQFTRIIRALQNIFCNNFSQLSFREIKLIIKSLTSVIKTKQKWALDLIQDLTQYDVLEQILKILRGCNQKALQQVKNYIKQSMPDEYKFKDVQKLKQIGQIVHHINLFLIHYIQISNNQFFDWQGFLAQFFITLSIQGSFYQNARRDVYFIFNNIICDSQEPDSSYHLLRMMVFQHKCIHVFAQCLEKQINQDTIQQLSNCIVSLFLYKNVETLAHDIISSNLVRCCGEAITRNFYCASDDAKENIIFGLAKLLERTQNQHIKHAYIYQIRCFESKIAEMGIYWKRLERESDKAIDKLLYEIQKCP